jgi:predicted Zn-dependent protease
MNRRTFLILAGLTLPLGIAGAQRSSNRRAQDDRPTVEQLRAMGTAYVQHLVDSIGEAKDPATRKDIGDLLNKLRVAAGIPTKDFHWVLVNDSSVNAAAVPGGHLIVNIGLVNMARAVATSDFPRDTAARHRRFLGFLGAVLGHEIAHHTLGHTEDVSDWVPAAPASASATDASLEARIERAMSNPSLLREQAFSRDRELAADRTGSLYLLRAGYTIQDAMDMFRALDSVVERTALQGKNAAGAQATDSLGMLSWLSNHPRASEREGALEAFRGNLKQDQARFDDALLLVRTGVQLDTAVVLLDTVLAHFPGLREAQHLRAAALHQQYIRLMPVEQLGIRGVVATYPSRFYTKIRGAAAADRAIADARAAYKDVMTDVVLPYSLSNLALLDAYAGQLPLAIARADSAVKLDDKSYEVQVNRGAVYYLAKRYADALTAFDRAATLAGGATPLIMFDQAMTKRAMGDSEGGNALLRSFVRSGDATEWSTYARTLLGGSSSSSGSKGTTGSTPAAGATGNARITAAVSLGQSTAAIRTALGAPDRSEAIQGGYLWEYESRGLLLGISRADGLFVIGMSKASSGNVDGVKVGDSMAKARSAWGRPVNVEDDATYFRHGDVMIMIEDDGNGVITQITAGVPR